MTDENEMTTRRKAAVSAGLIVCVLTLGALAAFALRAQKEPPVQAVVEERALRVEVQPARPADVTVTIVGYGEAEARDEVTIAPEISGRIVEVHPRLEAGEIIPQGEVLFAIDPRDYRARLDEAEATVAQLASAVERLQRQYAIDRQRLETFQRNVDLAKADLDRARDLYARDQIESKSFVEQREIEYNNAVDALDQLNQTLNLYPLQIEEARSTLAAAKASLDQRRADLERTVVSAPFAARIQEVDIEEGEYVTPGTEVLTISDDSVLDITVSLNSREARKWLRFNDDPAGAGEGAWFNTLEPVTATIAWTEALEENRWHGKVARVERFDEETRTLRVVVAIDGKDARNPASGRMPLVEGMFCQVEIPGRIAQNVIGVPAEAVGFDRDASGYRTVYIARKDRETGQYRLASREVRESHIAGNLVYIREGIEAGDLVVTTRLINPLENTLLEIEEPLPVETD